ncbi:MAG: ABC transporter permease [Pseudomonadota bacterium]
MQLELVKRDAPSGTMLFAAPFLAIGLTLLTSGILFALMGFNPFEALYEYFVSPLTELWSVHELLLKAGPLILIALGLAVCYRANVWNIGAEGQFTMGAVFGSIPPILFPEWTGPLTLPTMLVLGIIGGALYGSIPALLKVRFRANEILTSLMLAYIALLILDYLVRGPWRDPGGFNFPESRNFSDEQSLPVIVEGSRLHLGILLSFLMVPVMWFFMSRTLAGHAFKVVGEAPRAARFAGFSSSALVYGSLILSGALAGLAGIMEVAGPIGELRPTISPGYGFTAIIVAFLGRLNPWGILMAGLLLSLSFLGGEAAQITIGLSDKMARVVQGLLLFFVLGCDTLVRYQIRFSFGAPKTAEQSAAPAAPVTQGAGDAA